MSCSVPAYTTGRPSYSRTPQPVSHQPRGHRVEHAPQREAARARHPAPASPPTRRCAARQRPQHHPLLVNPRPGCGRCGGSPHGPGTPGTPPIVSKSREVSMAIEKCTVGIGSRGGSEATGAGTDAWIWSSLMTPPLSWRSLRPPPWRPWVDGLGEFHVTPHPVAVAPDVDDVAAVQQPVQQRGRHDLVVQDLPPVLEALVRGQHRRGRLTVPDAGSCGQVPREHPRANRGGTGGRQYEGERERPEAAEA